MAVPATISGLVPAADSATWFTPKRLAVMSAAAVILNLVDAIFTLVVVSAGLAVEANPLMDVLLEQGAVAFMLTKVSLVSLAILLFWRLRRRRLAVAGIVASVVVYSCIAAYHLQALPLLAEMFLG